MLMLVSVTLAFSQVLVTGKVMDEAKEPIIGANVIVKGQKTGTITDLNGNFKIKVPNQSSVLVVSFIGYATKEVTVGKRKVLTIIIK